MAGRPTLAVSHQTAKPTYRTSLGRLQPHARVPPSARGVLWVAQAIKEHLHVLRARMVDKRLAGCALPMQLDLVWAIRAGLIERGRGVDRAVEPDDKAAIAAGVDMPDSGEGFQVSGCANHAVDFHGGQRFSGDRMSVVHENEYRTFQCERRVDRRLARSTRPRATLQVSSLLKEMAAGQSRAHGDRAAAKRGAGVPGLMGSTQLAVFAAAAIDAAEHHLLVAPSLALDAGPAAG